MSIPTQPTLTTIANAAWQLYARRNATAAEITRVTEEGVELVKSDIMDHGVEWEFLRSVSYQPLTAYVSSYQLSADYKKLVSVRLMDGSRRGTATAGAATTITLAASDSGTSSDTQGKWIVITSGTGANQALQCKTFNSGTKIATLETSWTTTPDNTSVYLVVDSFTPLEIHTVYDRNELVIPSEVGAPNGVFHMADSAEGDLVLDTAPDVVYALEILYYADLIKMDTDTATNPRYARVLRLLNGLLIQGVYQWLCQNDARFPAQRKLYEQKLALTEASYLYPNRESGYAVRLDY